ncbi:hypothetical protein [Nocardioides aestuarii]|uniref:Uncharacterized protein n=1 Tax=Nocardioides aestuarii TaxID=252231 RepID=A0ABW4TKL0_9ACTN
MSEPEPQLLDLRLWDQSALVLFDWLMTRDEDSLPFTHPAQKQALRDLATSIEWARGLGHTDAELTVAQEQVARDMADDDRSI